MRRALTSAGFNNVKGPTDGQKATEFWIKPPPPDKSTQISPPGTIPRQTYDLLSEIQLIAN